MTSEVRLRTGRYEVAPHHCFACGELNTGGLRLSLHVADGRCWTEVKLRPEYQGWDGIAHGGITATILDEVMAWALAETDSWGFTARMAIDYRRPVPLEVPLRAEGWVTDQRRRIFHTAARLIDPSTGEPLATATGTYVAAPEERRRELKERYRFRFVAEPAASSGASDGKGSEGVPAETAP